MLIKQKAFHLLNIRIQKNGSIIIKDKKNNLEKEGFLILEDSGDAGDTYDYSEPYSDRLTKYKNLLKKASEIGDGFINRDLRDTQYIAKKAKEILFQVTKNVLSTSGNITDRLREDWGLVNVMKELNMPKYQSLGLTEVEERKDGNKVTVIKDWTKRNDHRHHAMDALTVAFTKPSYIQYLNHLNARKDENNKNYSVILAIEKKRNN